MIDTMNSFNFNEQQAVLQCTWQLFQARPSKEEVAFVEQQTIAWDILKNISELSLEEKAYVKLTCNGFLNKWVVCAIQMNPYLAFQIVAQMPDEKKIKFKDFILKIAEYQGSDFKTAMAVSLFNQTNIPYAIAAKDWLDFDSNNKSKHRII